MPMKWDAQSDGKLLLKILEAHPSLAVDVAKVAEIWPEADDDTHPTPRAIRERLDTIRKQAGISTPIRTTGSHVQLKDITRIQAETKDLPKNQATNSIKDEDEVDDTDMSMPATQKPPIRNVNFIRSSFSTPFHDKDSKSKNNSKSTSGRNNKRKRRNIISSDEDEDDASTSASASDSEGDVAPEQEPSSRSLKRRCTSKPKYTLWDRERDGQTENDAGRRESDESDAGYDPVVEREKEMEWRGGRMRGEKGVEGGRGLRMGMARRFEGGRQQRQADG